MCAPVVRMLVALCIAHARMSPVLPALWNATILVVRRHLVLASSLTHYPHHLLSLVAVSSLGAHLAINEPHSRGAADSVIGHLIREQGEGVGFPSNLVNPFTL